MRSLAAFIALSALLAAPALAGGETPEQKAAADVPKGEQVKCKRLDDDNTGSNMKRWKKVCKTVSEWRAEERELERQLNESKSGGSGGS